MGEKEPEGEFMLRQRLTCIFKGHLWGSSGKTPLVGFPGGHYTVHRVCSRCQKYERLERQAVSFRQKEQ